MDVNDNYQPDSDNESGSEQTPSWWIDDKTPGSGERPEWLPEKFKKVSDIAKSYNDLEKRLGQAPKEYDTSKAEKWFDPNHDALKNALQVAKDKHVPQEVVDSMFEGVSNYIDSQSGDFELEKQKLGTNANERIETLDNWARSNFSENAYNAIKESMDTAENIKAMEEIRGKIMGNEVNIPNADEANANAGESLDDIQSEMSENIDKYKSDSKYRREINERISKASSQGGFVDKQP